MTIYDLCYAIYKLFGQQGVIDLVMMLENTQRLNNVNWSMCEPCEYEFSPIYQGSCLVCGTDKENANV